MEDRELKAICGFGKDIAAVSRNFVWFENKWRHKLMDEQLKKTANNLARAKAAADSRWIK